jgi:TDG/mug DNA glycosylase family protein
MPPQEFPQLPALGIGFTDLAKYHSGNDSELPRDAFDVPALVAKIERFAPRWLAFTSKHGAKAALGRGIAAYGVQPERIGTTQVFVLPSPSGQARGHWSIGPWLELARRVRGA